MPSIVALGIVRMQIQFARGDLTPLLSVRSGQGKNHVVDRVAAVNDRFSGNKFTKANSFRLKKSVNTDFAALII
jgi:hypothetical protein